MIRGAGKSRQEVFARLVLDLSFARAKAVADHLVVRGIAPDRVRVSAAGDTEPRLITREREEQRLNRRVDVFLMETYITPRSRARPTIEVWSVGNFA